jgi:hypothetical protein
LKLEHSSWIGRRKKVERDRTMLRFAKNTLFASLLCASLLSFGGCAADTGSKELSAEGGIAQSADALQLSGTEISFSVFQDPDGVGNAGQQETGLVIASKSAYQAYFGHKAPSHINFAAGDAVVFYSGGVKPTGGFQATVTSVTISPNGKTVKPLVNLEAPGKDCIVTYAFSKPYVLAKISLPYSVNYYHFYRTNSDKDCSLGGVGDTCGTRGAKPCADDLFCNFPESAQCGSFDAPGTCAKAPEACIQLYNPVCGCDGQTYGSACSAAQQGVSVSHTGECEPPPPVGPFCGGIAGFSCPGLGSCVDNPNDGCDPANGGADCGGNCECNALAKCAAGYTFDSSPEVCNCVPPKEEAPFCGGIANIQCPGAGQCVDNPNDGCDPNKGGADCGGLCECNALAKCLAGYVFDNSPQVCSCVPQAPAGAFCVEFNKADANGNLVNEFYATNVSSYEEGKQLLANLPYGFINEKINSGTCAEQSQMCTKIYKPVCSESVTYGNDCELRVAVRQMAGTTEAAKAAYKSGACTQTCTQNSDCTDGFCGWGTDNVSRECKPFSQAGESCEGFVLPSYRKFCAPGLTCVFSEPTHDVPGTCQLSRTVIANNAITKQDKL